MFKDGDLVRIKDGANLSVENFAYKMLGMDGELKSGMTGKIDNVNYELGLARFYINGGCFPIFLSALEHCKEDPKSVTLTITFDGDSVKIDSNALISYLTQYTQSLTDVVSALYNLLGVDFND